MKKPNKLTRTTLCSVLLALALLVPSLTRGQLTTIVADGTTTSTYIPIYGLWADDYTRSQFIYPASMLEDLGPGSEISSLTFYSSTASQNWGAASFEVRLGEVSPTTISSYLTYESTTVYSGAISIVNNTMTIAFTTPYTYQGGNLMVEFWQTVAGTYHGESFYGISASGASASGYSSSGASAATFNQRDFLAKMQIEYTAGGDVTCYRVRNLHATDIDSGSLTLQWVDTMNTGVSYTVAYWAAGSTDTSYEYNVTDTFAVISGLNASTQYFFAVTTNCTDGSEVSPATGSWRTECGQNTIPYSEDFEGFNTMAPPECWTVLGGMIYVRSSTSNAHGGSQYLDFRGSSSGDTVQTVILPPMDQTTSELQLRFWTRPESFTTSSCGSLSAGYITDITDVTTFVPLATWSYDSFSAYDEKEVPMVGAPDGARIALRRNANSYNWYWYVDDLVVEPIPSCARPLAVSASNITEDGADITVTGTDGSSFRIYWSLDGTVIDSADVTDSPYSITDLSANTVYTVTAVTLCDDGTVTNSVSTSFRTGCGVITALPYFTNFDDVTSGEVPNCWTAILTDGSGSGTFPSVYSYSYNSYSSPKYFEFESSTGATEIVALPQFEDISQKSLSFYASVMNQNFVLEVGVMEDTTFVTVDTVNLILGTNNNWHNSYNPYTVYFANYSGDGNRMALRVTGTPGSSYTLMMDDFEVNDFEGCYPVSNLAISDLAPDGMTLAWEDELNSGATYTIYYRASGNTADTFTVTTSDLYYTFTGLQGNTTYYFAVAVDCGDAMSTVSNTISGTTLFACPVPTGLTVDTVTTTEITISWTPGYEETEWLLGIGDSLVTVNTNPYTITNLTPNTAYTLTLRSLCSTGDTSSQMASIEARTDCENGSCIITVNGTDTYGDGWNGNAINIVQGGGVMGSATFSSGSSATINVQVCSGDSVYLTFTKGSFADEMGGTVVDGGGNVIYTIASMNSHYTGDVLANTPDPCPSCISPLAFTIATSGDTATFNWTGSENGAWELVYGALGFNPETASPIATTTNSYEVDGLADGFYEGYVRTDCGDESSIWVGPVAFSIGIVVTNIDQVDTLYTCNAIIYDNGGASGQYTSYRNDQVVIYPTDATYGLTVSGHSQTEGSFDYLTVYEGVGTSGTILFQDNTSGVSTDLPFGPFDVFGPVTLAFHSDGSVYYDGFEVMVSCFDMAGCMHPYGVAATSVFSDNATVAFSGSNTGDYILVITDGAAYTDTVSVIGDSTYNFTGLTPLTTYTVSVFSNCGAGEISDPTTITLTTTAVPDLLPYSTGFETGDDLGWEILNGTETNKWYIDSAVNNGGSQSLYISNDGGATNSYSNSSSSNVYATKLLAFDSVGDYIVSYDWRCQGESHYYDWLRVFLAPASVSFTAGSAQPLGSSTYNASTAAVPEGWFDLNGNSTSPHTLCQSSSWNNVVETFSITNTGNYYLVFMWSNDGSGGTNPPAAVDNVQVARLSCPAPQNITLDALTENSAVVSWTPVGSETEWEVSCNGTTSVVTVPTAAITGLSAPQGYTVSVRAICEPGDTSFAATLSFSTPCTAVSDFPWVEDFEEAATFSCWSQEGDSEWEHGTGDYSSSTGAHSGSYNALISHNYTDDVTKLITPVLALTPGSPATLSFWYVMRSWAGDIDELNVYYRTSVADSWHLLRSYTSAAADWTFDTISLPNTTNTYQIAFEYTDNYGYGLGIDSIVVDGSGSGCAMPTVTVSNVEALSATITATGSGNGYELLYGTDDATYGNTLTSTNGVFNLTGLQPETQYYYAVRQLCDSGAVSNWAIGSFTTIELGCLAPTGLNVVATGYTDVTLNWTVGNEETAWEIHVFSSTIDTLVPATATTTVVNGLAADLPYSAAVRALCGDGTIPGPWSDTVSFTTQACQAVTGVTVSATATTATVSWTGTSASYRVIWGLQPFNPQDLEGEATVTTNSYTITGLDPEEDYAVVVYNNCAEGVSVPSSPVNFSTTEASGTLYTVTVTANNPAWGTVSGGGQYEEGANATITATANEGYRFVEWNDHNTDNPRTFTVTGDMSFVATFEANENGIGDVVSGTMSLYPNPASTSVTLGLEGFEGEVIVDVVDMNGRVVYNANTTSTTVSIDVREMPQGAYFVRVTSGSRTAVSKLIVK